MPSNIEPVIIYYLSHPNLPFNTCSLILDWIPLEFLLYIEWDVRISPQRDLEVTAGRRELVLLVLTVPLLLNGAMCGHYEVLCLTLCPEFVVPKQT